MNFPQNRPFFLQICLWKSRKIWVSEALTRVGCTEAFRTLRAKYDTHLCGVFPVCQWTASWYCRSNAWHSRWSTCLFVCVTCAFRSRFRCTIFGICCFPRHCCLTFCWRWFTDIILWTCCFFSFDFFCHFFHKLSSFLIINGRCW